MLGTRLNLVSLRTIAVIGALATILHAAPEGEVSSGSATAFISTDPSVIQATRLLLEGRLDEAQRAAGQLPDDRARQEILELSRRLRREYSLSPADLLAKLKPSIPDATSADIDRWIAGGQVQHRILDGEIRIFRREPGHLLRFCTEAMQRRDRAKPPAAAAASPADWTLHQHLRDVIDTAKNSDSPFVLPIRHRITYTLTVKPHRDARVGSTLAVWLPFPQHYSRQRDVKLLSSDPADAQIAPEAIDGNPVTGAAQRTVYLERKIANPSEPTKFQVKFEFVTSAYYPNLDDQSATPEASAPDGPARLSTYLDERPPHIVFTPELRARAKEIVGDDPNPLSRARKIFYWVDENLRWTPEEEYCLIPNLSLHGFTRGKGDCGVAAMLYITLCRIAGVPARWQSGWTTNPVGWNMHDWAEIYVEPWGWLPVDASYGRQKHDDPAIRDFYFGHADSHRLIVNLDYGRQLSPPKSSLRSEPADFQRGEVELDGKNLYFDDWEYDIEFERFPVE